jgi:lysine-ketoglutarate reductase/saccharopine dehydrogenase-like protein (TIGR00300 family)
MATGPHAFAETVTLEGHIIDSLILPRVMDAVMDLGGDFDVEELQVGRHKQSPSRARLRIFTDSEGQMHQILATLQGMGAQIEHNGDALVELAPVDGALPEDFYATTNLPTQVRLRGCWVDVAGTEMDLAIVIDPTWESAHTRPIADVKAGELVVVGHDGIRVIPMGRQRQQDVFSFRRSAERPNALAIANVARTLREVREAGGKVLFVVGPAIIHSGAGDYLTRLIRGGYVQAIFGGNAIAVHDVESQLFGTSLGVDLRSGLSAHGGHRNHMRAINAIRQIGSLEKAITSGLLRSGVMHEAIQHGVRIVLGGSVRDDGPMPGVVTDTIEAQRQMRAALDGVEMVVMVATMLHSIATGNLLPAHVKVVVVDINPATVTTLADRGTFQAVGLVTDADLFLRELVEELDLSDA